jgi:hypothetical protein
MSQTIPTNAFSGNPVPMGGAPMTSPSPDPNVFRLRGKNGQVVPIKASSVEEAFDILDEIEADPERQPYAVPEAILVGGLKGLGRMAAPLVKAVGLGNDYTDAALAPSNMVESGAGTVSQAGTEMAAGTALGGPVVRVAGKIIRPITKALTPIAKAAVEFSGVGERVRKAQKAYRIATGVDEAAVAAKKASELEKYRGVSQKEYELLKAQEQAKKIDKGRQAKAEFEARKAAKQAPKVELSPEQTRAAASQARLDAKLAADEATKASGDLESALQASIRKDVVHAPPAFPGQQSAKGATKARFAQYTPAKVSARQTERISNDVQKWAKSSDEVIVKRLKQVHDLSEEDARILVRVLRENN